MTTFVAVKALSAVEVDPGASHQHELNAGALRRALGFPEGRTEGSLHVVLYTADGEAVTDEGRFTLYDARERHPQRSEYRLYYDAQLVTAAAPGDIMVLYRSSGTNLVAVIAPSRSAVARRLLAAVQLRDVAELDRLRIVRTRPIARVAAADTVASLIPTPPVAPDYPGLARAFISTAAAAGRIPRSAEMAAAAASAVAAAHGELAPDLLLHELLEAETDIYFALETEVAGGRYRALQAASADLAEVMSFVLSVLQSRKSRRGQSLQHHFAWVASSAGIPFSAQCTTEARERPDFIVPSCASYHDRSFPSERLRLVACKSTARERWRQVLSEAERVREKYLLTIDPELSDEVVRAMHAAGLRPFLPAPLLTSRYGSAATLPLLGTVAELLDELRAAL